MAGCDTCFQFATSGHCTRGGRGGGVTERGRDRDRQKSDSRKRTDRVGGVGGDRGKREQNIKKNTHKKTIELGRRG